MQDAQPACPNCGRPLAPGAQECSACTSPADTQRVAATPAPRLLAGRYLFERLLGRGGAKEVWLAHDLTLDRPVAISRLRAGPADPSARARVRREARLMARLGDHPRIVTVYDALDDDGALVIVARYMAGGSLAERLAAAPAGRLGLEEVLRAGVELADALAHAHANGVVHRDVKPDNAWLGADGSAALGDFGIARAPDLPAEGEGPTGTPYYVAPEQASGEGVTGPAVDLYALGATLYELLCGRPPFTGATPGEVVAKHLTLPPTPPSAHGVTVPPALEALLMRTLAKLPGDRPGGAGEVRDALEGLRRGGGSGAPAPRAPLFGRERELRAAGDALRAARAGETRIVALAGEPGIGKTRLAAEIEAEARAAGMICVWGRGAEDAGAYGLWLSVLRELLPAAGELPAQARDDVRRLLGEPGAGAAPVQGEEGRARLFEAAVALLERTAGPHGLVVVLDDVHWADRSSLDLVRHVVRRAATARLLLVLTYREDGLESSYAAAALDELHHARGFERIGLAGLTLEAVQRFVPADAGLRDTVVRDIHARTGGNPFFVAELALTLADEPATRPSVPASVREVVLRRLEPLPEPSRDALGAAAVLGRPFTVATVARIAGLPRPQARTALEPARVARLLTDVPDAPGRLAFAHAIVRDSVRESLPPSRRGPLHAAVAGVLRAGTEARVAEAAHHALVAAREGEDPQPAFELSLEAAEEAVAVLAYAEAAGHYADAVEALDDLGAEAPETERARTLERLAAATMDSGDVEAGRAHYRSASAAARRRRDGEALARAALGFSEFVLYGETDNEAIDLLRAALDGLPPGDSALRVRVTALLGARLDPGRARSRREALVDEAIAMARRLGDPTALTAALWVGVLVNFRPEQSAVRAAAAAEILDLTDRVSEPNAVLWAHMSRFVDALESGDAGMVEAELAACAALVSHCRRGYFRWCLLLLRSTWSTFQGRLDEGAALSADAVALARRASDDPDQEYTVQGVVRAKLRWRPDEADRPALAAYAARYAELPAWTAMLADLSWALGRTDEARQALAHAARDDLVALERSSDALFGCAVLAEPAAGLGELAVAERLHAALLPFAARNAVLDHGWAAWGPVARALALLAAALGRADEAAAHFERAVALAQACGAKGWELRTLADWLAHGSAGAGREALLNRGLYLARELSLPWVSGRLADAAQAKTTP